MVCLGPPGRLIPTGPALRPASEGLDPKEGGRSGGTHTHIT